MTERHLLIAGLTAALDAALLGVAWLCAVGLRLAADAAVPGVLPGLSMVDAASAGGVVVGVSWAVARAAPVERRWASLLGWVGRAGVAAVAVLYLLALPHLSRTLLAGFFVLAPVGLWLARAVADGIEAGPWARQPVLAVGAVVASDGVVVSRRPLAAARSEQALFAALCESPAAEVRLATGSAAQLDRLAGLCAELGVDLVVEGAEGQRLRFASHRLVARAVKRVFDVVGASALLVVTAPLLGVAALAVWFESGGPVVLRQPRAGRFGVPFPMFKLRTMVVDAPSRRASLEGSNEADGPVFKLRSDPRVTRVGRVLRRWSIDELPQLLNVVRGEMSLVGPRPPLLDEVARYSRAERRRLAERPGLTCTWQVSGRSDLGWQTWLAMDLAYVDGWTLSGDLLLLLRTVPAVISGRGAR